jgi:signal transduction protein with GAF and PtsI domain
MPQQKSKLGKNPEQQDSINWLVLLSQLSKDVNLASENIQQTLDELMQRLIKEANIDAIAIWTIEDDTDLMTISSSAGLTERYIRFFNKSDRIPVGKGLVGSVMSSRKAMEVSTFSEYTQIGTDRWGEMVREEGIVSVLAVPMFVGGKILGAFNLYYKVEHDYSEEEKLFAGVLANQIAVIGKCTRDCTNT